MKWTGLLIWACIVHNVEACFDDGEFYCAKLWYFWFVVFFIFVFILIGAIITTNLCTKKKRRVGAKGRNARKRKAQNAKRKESKSSIVSKTTSVSTNNEAPASSKFPPSQPREGDFVASKRFFTQKGDTKTSSPNKTATSRDISTVENGDEMRTRDSILTTRDLPTSLVMEDDEINGQTSDSNAVKDTSC